MCFNGPKWKREVVQDHKFDFVDIRDFHSTSCGLRLRYVWLYILVIKSFLVYVSDLFTAVTMLSTNNWSNQIFESCPQSETNGCVFIPFTIAKWLFVGCILFGFLLLAYESRKTKKIIASRDISYAFTNIMANNYYSLRSYDHFCFFAHINDSTKTTDNFAFFIFFTFKDWKRLLLADGPRQAINALTLYAIYLSQKDSPGGFWDFKRFTNGSLITTALLITITFTVTIFAGSLLLLITAAICYIPLLCYIRGNLKEYCCHKVDKRIAEIVKRKAKQRLQKQAALARKEAAGDFSHLRNKKGELVSQPLPQPTLPNVSLDDEPAAKEYWPPPDYKSDYQSSIHSGPPPEFGTEYPPMPMYPYAAQANYPNSGHSMTTLADNGPVYDGASEYTFTNGQTPYRQHTPQPPSQFPNPFAADPDTRQRNLHQRDLSRHGSEPSWSGQTQPAARPSSGLAYDDEPAADDYASAYDTQSNYVMRTDSPANLYANQSPPPRMPSRTDSPANGYHTQSRNQYGRRPSREDTRQFYDRGGYGANYNGNAF